MDYHNIVRDGAVIYSSGTTGHSKEIYRSPENIQVCAEYALRSQNITVDSKILTVTRLSHAGGLLAQTIPGVIAGAEVRVTQFNPYTFLKLFNDYSHTFLVPDQMKALVSTKDFSNTDLRGKWILGGSDRTSWDLIRAFVERGAIVQPNWGMSEIGPIAINSIFDTVEKVDAYESLGSVGTIMGDTFYTDYKIVDGILWVSSEQCIYDGWFNTGDRVEMRDGVMFYLGRN